MMRGRRERNWMRGENKGSEINKGGEREENMFVIRKRREDKRCL